MRDYSEYRVWAPAAQRVELVTVRPDANAHAPDGADVRAMADAGDGWFTSDLLAIPGTRYGFRLDGSPMTFPDPRSLSQPGGVHDLSEVINPHLFDQPGDTWTGLDVRGRVIYEMHVGTFAADPATGTAGTFDSAISRLDDLAELGVDAVEVMPVAAFPGTRGWGYDGVGLFATHEAYGGPEAFSRFIRAAHDRSIAVILDVVYNHLGPSGNYLGAFGPYFTTDVTTPWGPAVNLGGEGSRNVRDFILHNARQWLVDFHVDGLRLDAVHALLDPSERHMLAELADAVGEWSREVGRPLTLIAESDLNDPVMVTASARGGMGMHAQWADDIHHHLHAWATREKTGYYCDFGTTDGIKKTLEGIFEHDGSFSTFREKPWGAPVDTAHPDYDASSFVAFIQDHDQVGNRAAGDRIHHGVSAEVHAAIAALYLLAPTTPMLFQGEEWAASAPFPFFSDHDAELGPLVTKGRTEEFARMGWSDPVPDPQDPSTFQSAFLDWRERADAGHASMLEFYTACLRLRREVPDFADGSFSSIEVTPLSEDAVFMRRGRHAVLAQRECGADVGLPHGLEAAAVLVSRGEIRESAATGLTLRGAGVAVLELAKV